MFPRCPRTPHSRHSRILHIPSYQVGLSAGCHLAFGEEEDTSSTFLGLLIPSGAARRDRRVTNAAGGLGNPDKERRTKWGLLVTVGERDSPMRKLWRGLSKIILKQ